MSNMNRDFIFLTTLLEEFNTNLKTLKELTKTESIYIYIFINVHIYTYLHV